MRIRHPYNFVPFAAPLAREPMATAPNHERFRSDLHSGTLHCTLETLSMLCIRPYFEAQPAEPYLPASSLKGMARSMAQTLGAGCASLFADNTKDPKHKGAVTDWKLHGRRGPEPQPRPRVLPDLSGFEPCTQTAACLVCRVFGYAPGKNAEQDDSLSGWAGKVRFHDSEKVRNWDRKWVQPPSGNARWQAQGTYHTPFYYPDLPRSKKPAGWKVYLHAKEPTGAATGFLPEEACIPEGAFFDFDVDYENLSGEEFAVLRFALTLQHKCTERSVRLAHKLGYGKGIGLGSCRVTAEILPIATRRFFGEEPKADTDPGCEIHKYFDLPGFAALQEFLSWESRPDQLLFPGYSWFTGPGSIAHYERTKNPQAAPLPIAEPEPEPVPKLKFPKRVDVRITEVTKKGVIRFETVDPIDGIVYTGTAVNLLHGAAVGTVCELKPNAPDPLKKTVSGRISWKKRT
jgi:hypothetical protein